MTETVPGEPRGLERGIALYLVLALGISTAFMLVARGLSEGPLQEVARTVTKFGPSLAGIAAIWYAYGAGGVRELLLQTVRWRIGLRWYAFAVLAPVTLFAVALFLAHGGSLPVPTVSLGAALPGALQVIATRVFLGGGLGEELGWRGYMQPALCRRIDPLRASLLVGVAHGLWHAPSIGASALGLTLITTPWAVVLSWMYYKSGRSLLPCILAHGIGNAMLPVLGVMYPDTPGTMTGWVIGLSIAGAAVVAPSLRKVAPES